MSQRRSKIKRSAAGRAGIRKVGRKAFRQGTHPQMWRATKHGGAFSRLGPMGPFSNKVIVKIERKPLYYQGLREFEDLKRQNIMSGRPPYSDRTIAIALESTVHDKVETYVLERIDTWVPKDTGSLRKAMISVVYKAAATVENFQKNTGPYIMEVGTPNIEYAKPVNKMPDWALQHPPHAPDPFRGTKGRRNATLVDPQAKSGWFNLILLNSRNKARAQVKKMRREVITPQFRELAKNMNKTPQALFDQILRVTHK